MNPLVQISEVSVKVCFVGRPRQSIHPGGGIAFEREERHPQAIDADVVEECSEPLLLPLPCGLPYALQRLCHALPSLCPVRALPARVPLGPRPWLHRLRCGRDRFVRRLHSYYGSYVAPDFMCAAASEWLLSGGRAAHTRN